MLPPNRWRDKVVLFDVWHRIIFLFTGKVVLSIYVREGVAENICVGIASDFRCFLKEDYEQVS